MKTLSSILVIIHSYYVNIFVTRSILSWAEPLGNFFI